MDFNARIFVPFGQITLHIINYTSQYQTQFEDFSNLCQLELDSTNRWIQLGALLPWDRMVEVYIKHKLRLSDEEALLSIS